MCLTSGCKSKDFKWRWCSRCICRLQTGGGSNRLCCNLLFVSQSSWVVTAVLDSSIVILEGVTLVLIDKEGEKNLPEAVLSTLWQQAHSFSHNSLRPGSLGYMYFSICISVCVCVQSLHRNVWLVSVVLKWPHLSGCFWATLLEKRRKESVHMTIYLLLFQQVSSSYYYYCCYTSFKLTKNTLRTKEGSFIFPSWTLLACWHTVH